MHLAILYNQKKVLLNDDAYCETVFEDIEVRGSSLFDRQPIYAHFSFLDNNGKKQNDLIVANVHFASG